MIVAFVVGCFAGGTAMAYVIASVYRTRVFPPEMTRTGRVRAHLGTVPWPRTIGFVVAAGLLAVVVWHGLDDILAAVFASGPV